MFFLLECSAMSSGGISGIMDQLGGLGTDQREDEVSVLGQELCPARVETNNRLLQPLPHTTVPRKRTNKTTRSNIEWRRDLKEIYSNMFKKQSETVKKVTLRSYCHQQDENSSLPTRYARIAAIWKELGLDD